MKQIELVRGMRDLLPTATPLWRRVEDIARDCFAAYGYDEIRLPVVEKKVLFERQLGEHTDLVEKEMYSFAAGTMNWCCVRKRRYLQCAPFCRGDCIGKGFYACGMAGRCFAVSARKRGAIGSFINWVRKPWVATVGRLTPSRLSCRLDCGGIWAWVNACACILITWATPMKGGVTVSVCVSIFGVLIPCWMKRQAAYRH